MRALATNGIDLPVLNVFRLLSRMGGRRLATESTGEVPLDAIVRDGVRGAPDVGALASLDGSRLCVLAWHYHDDDVPGPDAAVALTLEHLPAGIRHGARHPLPHRPGPQQCLRCLEAPRLARGAERGAG